MNEESKKKFPWATLLTMLAVLASGIAIGIGIASYVERELTFSSTGLHLLFLLLLLLGLYAAAFVQIIIHESGHLLFGLLTGYRFCSFRILSFIWSKSNGKIRFGRYSMAGTGGQCLLAPPDPENGSIPTKPFPTVLHHLGGSILNLVTAMIFFALFWLCRPIPYLALVWLLLASIGLLYALMNGIPIQTLQLCNDGANALELCRHPAARRALWIQLEINRRLTEGQSLRQMPDELFALPDEADRRQSSLVTAIAVFACNRLMDEHDFDKAGEQIDALLASDCKMAGIHRNLLICDRLYLECIGENRSDRIAEWLTPMQVRFMKSMKRSLTVLRVNYALARLYEKNPAKAKLIRADFEKAAKGYPYPSETENERSLLDIVDERACPPDGSDSPKE